MKGIHYTCQGESHKETNKVCQDASFVKTCDQYSIAVVCDGHGGSRYFRSDIGAQMAIKATVNSLEDFLSKVSPDIFKNVPLTAKEALPYDSTQLGNINISGTETSRNDTLIMEDPPQKLTPQDGTMRQLFSSIIVHWRDSIVEHANTNPLTQKEKESLMPQYAEAFIKHESIEKNYGCTLLCYVHTNSFWIAFQIGDGKCISFDKAGNYSEPIPWDDHCFLNKTTSLCDGNALNEFRYCYCGDGTYPLALFLGSDGIDDSFGETSNLVNFYSQILKKLANDSEQEAQRELEETLPELSKIGSKDDMSVACVFDETQISQIANAVSKLQQDFIKNKITELEDRIKEKTIKKEQLESSISSQNTELEEVQKKIDSHEKEKKQLNEDIDSQKTKLKSAKANIDFLEIKKQQLEKDIDSLEIDKRQIEKDIDSLDEKKQLLNSSINSRKIELEYAENDIEMSNQKMQKLIDKLYNLEMEISLSSLKSDCDPLISEEDKQTTIGTKWSNIFKKLK